MKKKKILVCCPVVRHDAQEGAFRKEYWENLFDEGRKKIANEETEYDVCVRSYKNKGVQTLESIYDLEICSAYAIPVLAKAQEDGYDAVALDCAGDQGLYGAKEVLDIPVVGAMESAYAIACLLGRKFSVLTIHEGLKRIIERQLLLYEMNHRCASVIAVGVRVEKVEEEMENIIQAWIEAGKQAVEKDGADVIVIGGTALSCIPSYQTLKKAMWDLGVPVLCGGETAFKVAEILIDLGLSQSKRRFPKPPEKKRFI